MLQKKNASSILLSSLLSASFARRVAEWNLKNGTENWALYKMHIPQFQLPLIEIISFSFPERLESKTTADGIITQSFLKLLSDISSDIGTILYNFVLQNGPAPVGATQLSPWFISKIPQPSPIQTRF